jgi:protein-disulfide isomerase
VTSAGPKQRKQGKPKPPPVGPKPAATRQTLWIVLAAAIGLGAVLILASVLLGGGDDETTPSVPAGDPALIEGIPQNGTVLGSPDAKVTLIQWEDFQCPFCGEYTAQAFPAIVEEYVRPGDVKVEFKGLAFLGDDSEKALRAALAAGLQGKFWEMEEGLFANQGEENSGWVTDELIDELAAENGLNAAKLRRDMDSAEVSAQIEAVEKEAVQRGIEGTPTFFVSIDGGAPYRVQPTSLQADAFRPILDDALAETR